MIYKNSNRVNEDISDEMIVSVKYYVKSGFYSDGMILNYMKGELEESSEIELKQLILDVKKNYCHQQQGDFLRLDKVFRKLTGKKIITMHKAGYSMDEGFDLLNEIAQEMHKAGNIPIGCCFYHEQDLIGLIELDKKKLYLAYGNYLDQPDAVAVGKMIVSTLKEEGFCIEWDGNKESRIAILNMKWDKIYNIHNEE